MIRTAPSGPVPLTDLRLWLKADQIAGVGDGAGLATWADQSGLGNDVTQGTGANQPIYRASVATLGSKPAVQFDGLAQYLFRTNAVAPNQLDWTIFAALKPTATTAQQIPVYNGDDNRGYGLATSTNTGFKGVLNGNVAWLSSSTAADTSAQVWTAQNVASGPTITLYLNNTSTGSWSGLSAFPLIPNAFTSIGAELGFAAVAQRFFAGYIAEVLVYQHVAGGNNLTSAQIASVTSYLRTKYSI